MSAPFAQLTFTSWDPPGGTRGGWQVKEVQGELASDETAWAVSKVAQVLRPVAPLPRFPSEEDIAGLPRRLLVVSGEDGSGLIVHSSPAGTDGSGRQGNVFNHVVLDRFMAQRLRAQAALRPVQLWRSGGWLTPFGVDAVQAAALSDLPGPNPELTHQRAAAFISADPRRQAGLGALVDACDQALRGGPSVVLLADDVDEGADWLLAVAFLCSPQTARDLTFSTFERAADLVNNGAPAVVSVVLKEDDLPGLTACSLTVVDPSQQAPLDGDSWSVVSGALAASAAGQLAAALATLAVGDLADRMVAVEDLSSLNPETAEAEPWWSLAVAVTESPALRPVWEQALALAEQSHGALDPETDAHLSSTVLAVHGDTPASAWRLLGQQERKGLSGVPLAELYANYVSRVLNPITNIAGPEPVPVRLLSPDQLGPVAQVMTDAIPSLLALEGTDEVWAAVVLRYLDLGGRIGFVLTDPSAGPLAPVVQRLCRALAGEAADAALAAAGGLHPTVPALVLRGLTEQGLGADLPVATASWLAPAVLSELGEGQPGPAHYSVLTQLARARDPRLQERRVHALIAVLAPPTPPGVLPRDHVSRALADYGCGRPWTPEELRALVLALPPRSDLDLHGVVARTLVDGGPGEASAQLATAFVASPWHSVGEADDFELDVLTLAQSSGAGWPSQCASAQAAVVLMSAGARVAQDDQRMDDDEWFTWRDLVLAAATRVTISTAMGLQLPVDDHALDVVQPMLSEPHHLTEEAAALLGQVLLHEPGLAGDLVMVTVRLLAGDALVTLPDPAFLVSPMAATPQRNIAAAALRPFLAVQADPRSWLQTQVARAQVDAARAPAVGAWMDAVLHDAPQPANLLPHGIEKGPTWQ